VSYLVSRFDGKESNSDLMITNRAYGMLYSAFLDYLGNERNELRLMFERTYAFNGVNLEREMQDDPGLLKQYILVWDKVIARLQSDNQYFSDFLGQLGQDKSFLVAIAQKVAEWRVNYEAP